jgi:hypothetical protein
MTSFKRSCRIVAAIVASLAALGAASRRAEAQAQGRPVVWIAVPDSFPAADVPALVVRTGARPQTPTVLVNKRDLRPETIMAALAAAHVAIRGPIKPGETQVTGVSHFDRPRPMKPRTRELATRWVQQLQTQPVTRIGNLGTGRWIEVAAP